MVWLATLCIRRDKRSILEPVLLSLRLVSGPDPRHRLQRHHRPDGQDPSKAFKFCEIKNCSESCSSRIIQTAVVRSVTCSVVFTEERLGKPIEFHQKTRSLLLKSNKNIIGVR